MDQEAVREFTEADAESVKTYFMAHSFDFAMLTFAQGHHSAAQKLDEIFKYLRERGYGRCGRCRRFKLIVSINSSGRHCGDCDTDAD